MEPSIHWIAVIPLVFVQLSFVLAVSFLVALLVPFLPDLRYLVQTGLMLLMFGSGVFYSYGEDKTLEIIYKEFSPKIFRLISSLVKQ